MVANTQKSNLENKKKPVDPYLTVTTTLSNGTSVRSNEDCKSETLSNYSSCVNRPTEESKSNSKLTKRQLFAIILLSYANFCLGILYSLQAPFFPREAELKGATNTQYGFIFGIYEAGIVVFSPIVGRLIPRISPQFLIESGLFIAGGCCVLFGALQWSPPGFTFVASALALRGIESIGGASVFTACYTIIAAYFPERIAHLFATSEMCFGIGMIVGPAAGGLLFELGNFSLPFFVAGALTLLGGVLALCVLPQSKRFEKTERTSILTLMSNFSITLNVLISVTAFFIIGFNDATLEHHIRQFTILKPSVIGGIFLFSGLLYASGNQFWGYLADKINNCHWACIAGFILAAIAFALCGPAYGLPLEPNIWLVLLAQGSFGMATGGQLVGSFTEGLKETVKRGFPENISTYAMISALFSSGFSTGGALGPVFGGFLVEHYGYRKACYGIIVLELIMIIIILVWNLVKRNSQNGRLRLNPYSLSLKSIDRESGVWNDWQNKASISGLSIVRRNLM
ncbi:MFS-type transporter-like protein [Dinothrombium tinctorium]|uniref:MFS-type transporter-like protein n=1 Tax=Dinothrombium tinctorium TaxID=1965070 RepID=A0A3S4R8W5_9ACAR|nr:MFS-type transporter-like protein [Dinothrombium tinctorium]RWS14112.1 MFS-type transporter-like protein [Dinothrombium tinctorium]